MQKYSFMTNFPNSKKKHISKSFCIHVFSFLYLVLELSVATAVFAKSAAMLGNVEEHTTLSRALSQLAETEEKIEAIHRQEADTDFYVIAELLKDYIALIGAVKVSLHGFSCN